MADCECTPGCPFFNGRMANAMPAIAESMKKKYCQGHNHDCARYMVFRARGKGSVPEDLLPNHTDRAKQLIAAAPAS
ncbi:MAG: hypothetical protein PVJ57_04370 [Phycisphaerae bacterium]|jgi:hypothetical protein